MIVLGLDTATSVAAVGLARDGVAVGEAHREVGRGHAGIVPSLIEEVLRSAGVAVEAVEGIGVSIGPGSFTGLRIGLGIAKGMAFAGHVPVVGVPTLEALALAADAPVGSTVCAALDARKREVYAAAFRITGDGACTRLTPDEALTPAALAARLDPSWILVGDAARAYPDVLGGVATVRPFDRYPPRGGIVARLGWQRIMAGEAPPIGDLEPAYVRPPEAELPRAAAPSPRPASR